MCTNVVYMTGNIPRLCHRCWQCRRDRVNDWVGRCIAEWKTCGYCAVVTLTYGKSDRYDGADHVNAHALFYSDVQKYLKRLRNETEGRVRFFCCGEYGEKYGRAHWHLILFFENRLPPNLRVRERYIHEGADGRMLWPHGWSYWDRPSEQAIRYVAKYVLKNERRGYSTLTRFSTQPELGNEYFRQQAELAVEQQLPPSLWYSFPNEAGGRVRKYRLSRAAAFKYLRAYRYIWQAKYGNNDWPQSDIIESFEDVLAKKRQPSELEFRRLWEMDCNERKRLWIFGVRGDAANVTQIYPKSMGDEYRRLSRGD